MQVQGPFPSSFARPASVARPLSAPAEGMVASRPAEASTTGAPPSRPAPPETSLWDLLTPEERDFFARAAELGPLSYRPGGANPIGVPLPTGQRIDVRG